MATAQTFHATFGETSLNPKPSGYDIFVGIDGTGLESEAAYDNQFANSFVHQLYERWITSASGRGNAIYLEGPNWNDTVRPTKASAEKAFDFVRGRFRSITSPVDKIFYLRLSAGILGRSDISAFIISSTTCSATSLSPDEERVLRTTMYPRIFLAGWSRGGAGVIHLASLLKSVNIRVYCLLLFDAVDRTITSMENANFSTMLWDVGTIPSNVKYCYHAMRSGATRSRGSFGNCGTSADSSSTVFVPRYFFCSHGGMGGVPWKQGDDGLARLSAFCRRRLAGSPEDVL